jgi:hypothetical protein
MSGIDISKFLKDNQTMLEEKKLEKLPVKAHILSGWPLILIIIGGLIGGALGGGAYVINLKIYKSNLSTPIKILLNIATGLSAFVIWLIVVVVIHSIRMGG